MIDYYASVLEVISRIFRGFLTYLQELFDTRLYSPHHLAPLIRLRHMALYRLNLF